MMRITYTIRCDYRLGCPVVIEVQRPVARTHGWNCDTRLGIDFCPSHAHFGSKVRDRGKCAFCGKSSAIKKSGLPVYHDVPGVKPIVRCPGIHQQVIRAT